MNVSCPECSSVYRIDPERVPEHGVRTRCRECATPFRIAREPHADRPGHVMAGERLPHMAGAGGGSDGPAVRTTATQSSPTAPAPATPAPAFGPQDPQTRAHRLARALVSDIKFYNRERWARSRDAGTLRKDFREEILKSWDEYVEQVGEPMAKRTPFFRDALNDILAEGQHVF